MKKLKKLSLFEIEDRMEVLSAEEASSLFGEGMQCFFLTLGDYVSQVSSYYGYGSMSSEDAAGAFLWNYAQYMVTTGIGSYGNDLSSAFSAASEGSLGTYSDINNYINLQFNAYTTSNTTELTNAIINGNMVLATFSTGSMQDHAVRLTSYNATNETYTYYDSQAQTAGTVSANDLNYSTVIEGMKRPG